MTSPHPSQVSTLYVSSEKQCRLDGLSLVRREDLQGLAKAGLETHGESN